MMGGFFRVKLQVTSCYSARACNEADGNCAIYFPVGIQVAAFCKRLGAIPYA